jgi:hypothetical protein
VTSDREEDENGDASSPAFTLAALDGRNWELLLFSTVDRPGRHMTRITVTMIQLAMISQRNRTVKRPSAANKP